MIDRVLDMLAWPAAVMMALGLAVWGIWASLFETGLGVSDDKPLGLLPRLLSSSSSPR